MWGNQHGQVPRSRQRSSQKEFRHFNAHGWEQHSGQVEGQINEGWKHITGTRKNSCGVIQSNLDWPPPGSSLFMDKCERPLTSVCRSFEDPILLCFSLCQAQLPTLFCLWRFYFDSIHFNIFCAGIAFLRHGEPSPILSVFGIHFPSVFQGSRVYPKQTAQLRCRDLFTIFSFCLSSFIKAYLKRCVRHHCVCAWICWVLSAEAWGEK